jgi:hypothetical protein|tara:strand:+ start:166 stop:672 length:507 start_codon:yes stop_codon:yes gene_type:complete
MSEFNHHVYLISYEDSLDGPIKIGYSHHPPTRLKQLQTGNPRRLTIFGNLGFKDELAARSVEKIILHYFNNNNLSMNGEWYDIGVKEVLTILSFFPHNREKLFERTEIKEGKIINFTNLINYGFDKKIINEDEWDHLRDIFDYVDEDNKDYEFTDFIEESEKNLAESE